MSLIFLVRKKKGYFLHFIPSGSAVLDKHLNTNDRLNVDIGKQMDITFYVLIKRKSIICLINKPLQMSL